MTRPVEHAQAFCRRFDLRVPVLLAPMAGACPPELSAAVANAGGLGACGALLMQPYEIASWTIAVRAQSNGGFQINLWVPDPPPTRALDAEAAVRTFLARWGPPVAPEAGDATPPDFAAQCEAVLAARPNVISSIMGLLPPEVVARAKAAGIAWFATVTTVAEARAAEAAGADAVVAQGAEAGGHRGSFNADAAERALVGTFALVPAVADAVEVPVIAAGGIADARGTAAALVLGASAVQVGSGFLRCPEAGIHPAWTDALAKAAAEDTVLTRVFSGRAGRSLATAFVRAAFAPETPRPAPYPVQRALTMAMRSEAHGAGDLDRMQAWAGQASALASGALASDYVEQLWSGAHELLGTA